MSARHIGALCLLAGIMAALACDVVWAQMFECFGSWSVQTRLVAASDATNPTYRPGDLRVEQWDIRQSGAALQLTTQAGTIAGAVGPNYTLVFASAWDTGLGVTSDIRIEARMTSSASMAGTIKVNYYSAQFGYQVGLDAWTFQAIRVGG